MKDSVFNTVISIRVLSIDTTAKTCSLVLGFGDRTKVYEDVKISGLLLWRFGNDVNYRVGSLYTDTISSTDRFRLPFQFIIHGDVDDPCYFLEAVEVKKSEVIYITDPFGGELVDYINQYHKPKYYRRFRNYLRQVDSTSVV